MSKHLDVPPERAADEPASLRGGLSVRITGIVFWGMVLAGLLIVLVTIQAWEEDLKDIPKAYLAEVALTLQEQLEASPELRPGRVQAPPLCLMKCATNMASPPSN